MTEATTTPHCNRTSIPDSRSRHYGTIYHYQREPICNSVPRRIHEMADGFPKR